MKFPNSRRKSKQKMKKGKMKRKRKDKMVQMRDWIVNLISRCQRLEAADTSNSEMTSAEGKKFASDYATIELFVDSFFQSERHICMKIDRHYGRINWYKTAFTGYESPVYQSNLLPQLTPACLLKLQPSNIVKFSLFYAKSPELIIEIMMIHKMAWYTDGK